MKDRPEVTMRRSRAPIVWLMQLALAGAFAAMVPSAAGLGAAAWAQQSPDARKQARDHYMEGRRLYDQGDYKGAIGEFAAADALVPSALNDFNIALCHDKAGGDVDEAIRYYKSYLKRAPDAGNRAPVEASIARLEQQQKKAADDKAAADKAAADKAAADKAAADAAAAAAVPPPSAPDAKPAAPTTAPAPATGDPDLDRVAAIDVNAVRDQRYGRAEAAPPPAAGPAVAAPAKPGAPAAPRAPAPPIAPAQGAPEQPKEKPVYKKWWFWAVVGVSAIVVVSMFDSDNDSTDSSGLTTRPDGTGVPLFRF